jgi:hypothetical protein
LHFKPVPNFSLGFSAAGSSPRTTEPKKGNLINESQCQNQNAPVPKSSAYDSNPQNGVRLRPIRIRFITRKTDPSGIPVVFKSPYETRPRHSGPSDTSDGLNARRIEDFINGHLSFG